MANNLFKMIFPSRAAGLLARPAPDPKAIRLLSDQIRAQPMRAKLITPPAERMAELAQKASPQRFERADLAARLCAERPERGSAALWREASETDADLGEVVVLLDPLVEEVEVLLAASLGRLSVLTGRIERKVDEIDRDPRRGRETAPFHVADLERERIDAAVAATHERAAGHLEAGAAEAARAAAQDARALGARRLKEEADPERLLQAGAKVVLKKKHKE